MPWLDEMGTRVLKMKYLYSIIFYLAFDFSYTSCEAKYVTKPTKEVSYFLNYVIQVPKK